MRSTTDAYFFSSRPIYYYKLKFKSLIGWDKQQFEEIWSDLEHTLQDPPKHSHFTWDLEHTLLLKPDSSSASLSVSKCLVTQILCPDDEPLQLLPHAHDQKPFWDDLGRKHWTSVCEGESLLEELDALAAIVGGGSRAVTAIEVKRPAVGACHCALGAGCSCWRGRVWKESSKTTSFWRQKHQNDVVLMLKDKK